MNDLDRVKENGLYLQFVNNQTEQLCVEAVKQHGWALQFVKKKTPELCLEAVKQNGWALQFVKKKTPEICLEAVKHDGFTLKFVKQQTSEICLEAVKQDGLALQFVKKKTPEICVEAVKQYKNTYKYYVNPFMRNCLVSYTLLQCCISMIQLRLPSYVLMDIIDIVLMDHTVTHYIKIDKVIKLNEAKIWIQ